jgi:hypothetical protein
MRSPATTCREANGHFYRTKFDDAPAFHAVGPCKTSNGKLHATGRIGADVKAACGHNRTSKVVFQFEWKCCAADCWRPARPLGDTAYWERATRRLHD